MATKYEVLEVLRIYGPLTTSEITRLIMRSKSDYPTVARLLFILRYKGLVRLVEKRIVRKYVKRKWALSDRALELLRKEGVNSFYDLENAKKLEKLRLSKGLHGFKRFV